MNCKKMIFYLLFYYYNNKMSKQKQYIKFYSGAKEP